VTRFDKRQWQGWLFTTTRFLHQWANNPCVYHCIIANDSLVCFSWGLFLGPVWHARVLEWSSNDSGLTGQAPPSWKSPHNWPESLAIELWYLELKWVSGETIWQCSTSTCGKICHFVAPRHPWPPPLYDHLWYWCKNYLKWQAIQLLSFVDLVNWKTLYNYGLVEKGTQAVPCILKICCILYFKIVFLYIYINACGSRLFSNPITYAGVYKHWTGLL